nr:hypothetical protein [Lachnospiraceae bacterium]
MSQQKKGTYEIYTSMSEELILEELGQMKQKFIPAAKLHANRFLLMSQPPKGRRRTGGMVQLEGSICQQDEMRCLRIKTCSGVGFVVGLSAAIFFLCVIAVSVPAAGWKTEILFPMIFLLVLAASLFTMKRSDSIAAEKILREHFEGTDRVTEFQYTTGYSPEQCMEFMKHDNENDLYEYEWRQEKSFGALIIKNYKRPDRIQDFDGRPEWGFVVRFRQQPGGNGTVVEVKLVPTEKLPYIHNKEKIDRFFENKLGAIAEG